MADRPSRFSKHQEDGRYRQASGYVSHRTVVVNCAIGMPLSPRSQCTQYLLVRLPPLQRSGTGHCGDHQEQRRSGKSIATLTPTAISSALTTKYQLIINGIIASALSDPSTSVSQTPLDTAPIIRRALTGSPGLHFRPAHTRRSQSGIWASLTTRAPSAPTCWGALLQNRATPWLSAPSRPQHLPGSAVASECSNGDVAPQHRQQPASAHSAPQ